MKVFISVYVSFKISSTYLLKFQMLFEPFCNKKYLETKKKLGQK